MKIEKVVVNTGIGRISQMPQFEEKVLPEIMKEMAIITGQKPKTIGARKSIAGFKIRTNQIVGLVVTLRGKRRNDFVKKLINVVLPRTKDFRGVSEKSIDKGGNLNIGLREQYVFPEINPEISRISFGLEITFIVNTKDRGSALLFYKSLGLPFKKR